MHKNQDLQKDFLATLFTWLPWIIIFFGCIARFYHYLANRSLWLDEAMLALNIVNRSFLQLIKPLDYNQGAPIGFLMVERLMVVIFGNSEYALRLFPFLCGIIALFLFYVLASHYISPKGVPLALALFAFSPSLIYYSSEVKQYSTDVAIALLLFVIATYYIDKEKLAAPHIILFGSIGAFAIWFSHPSLFILMGIVITLAYSFLKRAEYRKLRSLFVISAMWSLSFIAFYILSLHDLSGSQPLLNYWTFAFMPLPPSSISDAGWFILQARDNLYFVVTGHGAKFWIFGKTARNILTGLVALSLVAGCISKYSERREIFLLLISPLLLALLASGFHKYPFYQRFLLFILPAVLLLVAEGAELIRSKLSSKNTAMLGIIIIGLLLIYPVANTCYRISEPHFKHEIKPVIEHVVENQQDGDVLYIYHGAVPAFEYYSTRYGNDANDYIVGVSSRHDLNNYINDLDKLRGNGRVWILFSHVFNSRGVDEEKFFLQHLDEKGIVLDSFKSPGASVYLYDLSFS